MSIVIDRLEDGVYSHAIDLTKIETELRQKVLGHLKQMETDLVDQLQSGLVTDFKRQRLEALLSQTRQTIATSHQTIKNTVQSYLSDFSKFEEKANIDILNQAVGVPVFSVMLTPQQLSTIASNVVIEGGPLGEWLGSSGSLSETTKRQLGNQIRLGVSQGESIQDIVKRVRGEPTGKRYSYRTASGKLRYNVEFQGGVLPVQTRQAKAIVRTSVHEVSNRVRDSVYEENSEIIKVIESVATLDSRTTPLCASYDGLRFYTKSKKPVGGHKKKYLPVPRHWQCRSTYIPILAELNELDKLAKSQGLEVPEPVRAAVDGLQPTATDMDTWLKNKSEAFQNKLIESKAKADLWRSGKIKLRDLTDNQGNVRTLAQLESRFAEAPSKSPTPAIMYPAPPVAPTPPPAFEPPTPKPLEQIEKAEQATQTAIQEQQQIQTTITTNLGKIAAPDSLPNLVEENLKKTKKMQDWLWKNSEDKAQPTVKNFLKTLPKDKLSRKVKYKYAGTRFVDVWTRSGPDAKWELKERTINGKVVMLSTKKTQEISTLAALGKTVDRQQKLLKRYEQANAKVTQKKVTEELIKKPEPPKITTPKQDPAPAPPDPPKKVIESITGKPKKAPKVISPDPDKAKIQFLKEDFKDLLSMYEDKSISLSKFKRETYKLYKRGLDGDYMAEYALAESGISKQIYVKGAIKKGKFDDAEKLKAKKEADKLKELAKKDPPPPTPPAPKPESVKLEFDKPKTLNQALADAVVFHEKTGGSKSAFLGSDVWANLKEKIAIESLEKSVFDSFGNADSAIANKVKVVLGEKYNIFSTQTGTKDAIEVITKGFKQKNPKLASQIVNDVKALQEFGKVEPEKVVSAPKVTAPAFVNGQAVIGIEKKGAPNLDSMERISMLGGSTGAELYMDANGKKWVIKRGGGMENINHVISESVTDSLYKAAGVDVPKQYLIKRESDGAFLKVSEYEENSRLLSEFEGTVKFQEIKKKIADDFIFDALFENWDVVGLSQDNIMILPNGKYLRLDNGSGLAFRAQGARKDYLGNMKALKTMRDFGTNESAAEIFGDLKDKDFIKQYKKALKKKDKILATLDAQIDIFGSSNAGALGIAGKKSDYENIKNAMEQRFDVIQTELNKLLEMQKASKIKPIKRAKPPKGPQVDEDKATLIKKSKSRGYTVEADEDLIEDTNMLYYQDFDEINNTPVSNVEFKLSPKGKRIFNQEFENLQSRPESGIRVKEDYEIEFKGKQFDKDWDGEARITQSAIPQQYVARGDVKTIEMEGLKVKMLSSGGNHWALMGKVFIQANEEITANFIERVRKVCKRLGIDASDVTEEYQEYLYLMKTLYANGDDMALEIKAVTERFDIPVEGEGGKLDKLKEAINSKSFRKAVKDANKSNFRHGGPTKNLTEDGVGEVKYPKVPLRGEKYPRWYNPKPNAEAEGFGFKTYDRWDYKEKDLDEAFPDFGLQHSTPNQVKDLVGYWMDQGGQVTCTTERLRKGINIISSDGSTGMSTEDDIRTGGADYFFTRLFRNTQMFSSGVFIFKKKLLMRADTKHYGRDRYGDQKDEDGNESKRERNSTPKELLKGSYQSDNEAIIKKSFDFFDNIDFIPCADEDDVQDLITLFKSRGYAKFPDGRRVEDVVMLKSEMDLIYEKRKRDLGSKYKDLREKEDDDDGEMF